MFDKKSITVRYYDKKGVLLETFTHKISGSTNCYGVMVFDPWTVGDYRRRAPKGWNRYLYADDDVADSGRCYESFYCYEYRYQQDHARSLSPAQFADYQLRGVFPKDIKQAV